MQFNKLQVQGNEYLLSNGSNKDIPITHISRFTNLENPGQPANGRNLVSGTGFPIQGSSNLNRPNNQFSGYGGYSSNA